MRGNGENKGRLMILSTTDALSTTVAEGIQRPNRKHPRRECS